MQNKCRLMLSDKLNAVSSAAESILIEQLKKSQFHTVKWLSQFQMSKLQGNQTDLNAVVLGDVLT